MPPIRSHPAGAFCWAELATTDQAAAKSFYSAIFGWVPTDSPIGPEEYYTTFKLGDAAAAAAYTISSNQRSATPPHWNLYVAVESADDAARRVSELGGKVIAGPFDVATFGRMAIIHDPAGAVLCLWQAKDHPGITVTGEHGTLCWADLSTLDSGAAAFYEGLFGWEIGALPPYPPEYGVIRNGGQPIGGIPPAAYRNPETPPHWMLFFRVSDADAVHAKAVELGAKVLFGPVSVGGARLAVMADPQGATFSVLQPPA